MRAGPGKGRDGKTPAARLHAELADQARTLAARFDSRNCFQANRIETAWASIR